MTGDYSINAGSLAVEIGGLTPGTEHDQVVVTGATNLLGGSLDVSLINAFTPGVGDSFDILNWGSLSGIFVSLNLPTLGGGLDWDTSNLLIDGTLSVVSLALIGDLDGDGFVGLSDIDIILGNWNQAVPPGNPLADVSGPGGVPDGFICLDDLDVVLGNWNTGTPPSNTANIPEPTSLALIAVGVPLLLRRHKA